MMDSADRDYTSWVFCNGFKHIRETNGYWNHFKFGGIATLWLTWCLISSIIHIFIPHLLPSVADNIIVHLGARSMKNRNWIILDTNRSPRLPEWLKK